MLRVHSIIGLLVVSANAVLSDITCKDGNNNPVDWFVIYKLPRIARAGKVHDGAGYIYYDSAMSGPKWFIPTRSINDSQTPLGYTLNPLYTSHVTEEISYILYNDETPDGNRMNSKGHTKGTVIFGEETGFWLVHSVPKFPNAKGKNYDYPQTGMVYGQSILCVTYNLSQANNIGLLLMYNEPQVYSKHVEDDLANMAPNFYSAAEMRTIRRAPFNISGILVSRGGAKFIAYAKNNRWNQDLYADWLNSALVQPLYVETWLNGASRLPSNCSTNHPVYNVKSINISQTNSVFNSSRDHSKWAVSTNRVKPWLCIGDINRMRSQYGRGGGTVCFQNRDVWSLIKNSVAAFQQCGEVISYRGRSIEQEEDMGMEQPAVVPHAWRMAL